MYCALKHRNAKDVRKELLSGGHIIIAAPGSGCVGDIEINFYHRPRINRKGDVLNCKRSKEQGRAYLLRLRQEKSFNTLSDFCKNFFERLYVGFYDFEINPQCCTSRGLFEKNGITIYVSHQKSFPSAFRYALKHMIEQEGSYHESYSIPAPNEEHLGVIIEYVMKDLKTGDVLKKNISAGEEADKLLMA